MFTAKGLNFEKRHPKVAEKIFKESLHTCITCTPNISQTLKIPRKKNKGKEPRWRSQDLIFSYISLKQNDKLTRKSSTFYLSNKSLFGPLDHHFTLVKVFTLPTKGVAVKQVKYPCEIASSLNCYCYSWRGVVLKSSYYLSIQICRDNSPWFDWPLCNKYNWLYIIGLFLLGFHIPLTSICSLSSPVEAVSTAACHGVTIVIIGMARHLADGTAREPKGAA